TGYANDPQTSNTSGPVVAATFTSATAPVIPSSATVATAIAVATEGSWTPTASSTTYQWQVATGTGGPWSPASGTGTTSATYTPAAGDLGKYLRLIETGHLTGYANDPQTSNTSGPVAAATFTSATAPVIASSA